MGNTRSLTDKPITKEVVVDAETGKVVAAHLSTVVTDPTAANAVQIPDGDVYPTADATGLDPLAVHDADDPTTAINPDQTVDTDEVQSVTITGSPTGGTFTLTFSGSTTAAINHNAAASTVQSALRAIDSIDGANVSVSGSAGGPYTVTFIGELAATNVAAMTATSSLTGGTTPGVTIATVTAGYKAG
jgi:hypothetical protein